MKEKRLTWSTIHHSDYAALQTADVGKKFSSSKDNSEKLTT